VHGLELGRRTHIDHDEVLVFLEPVAQGFRFK
jgi:hypothetical protein